MNQNITRNAAQKAKIQTRSMNKQNHPPRKLSAALLEAKKKARQKMNSKSDATILKDVYQTAMNSLFLKRGMTGLILDDRMANHFCLWDENYPECPNRLLKIKQRIAELNLLDRVIPIQSRLANKEEILLKHTEEHYELLKSTSGECDFDKLENLSSKFDAVYIHPNTFELSLLACGSTIALLEKIISNQCQNGMAIIRPPGHHAMKSDFNGYCFFNNVAIAAQYALNNLNINKILIVDWDVHHGQGVQRMFYDDPRVLYFSIHRYEYGTFWPNLRESDFHAIGEYAGKGYNFNIPLNKTKMKNGDYLAIFQQLLIPVALEFQPELIIVSAGYDAAVGCPEGEMEITPACYSHLLLPLLALANGKVAVVLEGGYCLDSLAEGAALTLKTLLGDPCPLMEPLEPPSDSIVDTILNSIYVHKPYWKCLQLQQTYDMIELNNVNPQPDLHKIEIIYQGDETLPEVFPTRNCYPIMSSTETKEIEERLNHLRLTTQLTFPSNRVCFVYDDIMLGHRNLYDNEYPERPDRIELIKKRFDEFLLTNRMKKLNSRQATTDELCLAHSYQHVSFIRKIVEKSDELEEISKNFNSIYLHPKTFECATYAVGSVLQVVDEVLNGSSRSGVCVVRPPGHHAESDMPHGFCIFNNVAIAALYAIRDHGLKRVLIVDWDVHHGNGIQHIFEKNPNVLYISLHRYDHGSFFPRSTDADYTVVGEGQGEGFNVNIPWNKKTMGDMEYFLAFQHVVLPIAYEYNPELVLISAGFDACIGDPLGGYKVTPEAYGYFTHWLSSLANGRVILCLEGGYNTNSISYAMTMCTKTLLGDPLPSLHFSGHKFVNHNSIETLQNVISVQQKYWKCLRFLKKLPDFIMNPPAKENKILNEAFTNLTITLNDSDRKEKSNVSSETSSNDHNDGEPQPGPSGTQTKPKTLSEFIEENMEALKNEEMYAVVPLKDCPHLSLLNENDMPKKINTRAPCLSCNSLNENWICLFCFEIYCGRYINEHMLYHHLASEHCLVLSFSDLSVWCYKCESYIDNPKLYKYKNGAHQDKFNEKLPWTYEQLS